MKVLKDSDLLCFTDRADFRQWLIVNHASKKECWIAVKRGKTPPDDALWYLDAVEEALCFGWIDSTVKKVDGVVVQRFSPRAPRSSWTELNKERCRRLEALGLMTEKGRAACPDLSTDFEIHPDILCELKANKAAWSNFISFHPLYQRVRIDNIQRVRACPELFRSRLLKLIKASEKGEMIGEWHDYGRLLDY